MKRAARLGMLAGMSAALLIGTGTSPSLAAEPAWKLMNSPQCKADDNLQSVDMLSTTEGWAVGAVFGKSQDNALIERWDGRTWTPSPLGTLKDKRILLGSVAAISSHDVWATGIYDPNMKAADKGTTRARSHLNRRRGEQVVRSGRADGAPYVTDRTAGPQNLPGPYIVAHYDGKSWTYQERPKPPAGYHTAFSNLKAVTANDVWSVGSEWKTDSSNRLLGTHGFIDRWDGKTWQRMTLPPDVTTQPAELYDVDGLGANDLWLSGEQWNFKTGKSFPFTLHWDGTKFSMLKLPLLGFPDGWDPQNIAVQNDNSVYVSGNVLYDNGTEKDALVHWNGTAWENMPKRPIQSVTAMAFNRGTSTLMVGGRRTVNDPSPTYAGFDGKTWVTYQQPSGLGTRPQGDIYSIRYGQGNSSKTAYAVGDTQTSDLTEQRCYVTSSP